MASALPAAAEDWSWDQQQQQQSWDQQQQPWDQQQQNGDQQQSGDSSAEHMKHPKCQGAFEIAGKRGSTQVLVPTGWVMSASSDWSRHPEDPFADVLVKNGTLIPYMGSRAYFADNCTAGKYDYKQYMRSDLLGKVMRFTTDLKGAGCGCNAAFYMTSMGHNDHVSECFDYYCDANNVCGESCAEIDIMEANQYAFHITLHTSADPYGTASGFGGGGAGWNGPRNWTSSEYGKGAKCIDTRKPFQVAVSFPLRDDGVLEAMQVTLSQRSSRCDLQMRVDSYMGMQEMTDALREGMTPIVSYWADDDMMWLDGKGDDSLGPCDSDDSHKCADFVKFYDFFIEDLPHKAQNELEKSAQAQDAKMEKIHPTEPPHNWWDDQGQDQQGSNEWWDDSSTDSTTGWQENPDNWNQDAGSESSSSTPQWWETSSSSTEWWENPASWGEQTTTTTTNTASITTITTITTIKATSSTSSQDVETEDSTMEVIMKTDEEVALIAGSHLRRPKLPELLPFALLASGVALALAAAGSAARRARAAFEAEMQLQSAQAVEMRSRPSSQLLLDEGSDCATP